MKNLKKSFEEKKRAVIKYFFTVFLICGFVVFAVGPISCRMTEEGIEIVPSDKICPVVESFEVVGNKVFSFACSERILVSNAVVKQGNFENPGAEIPISEIKYDESGQNATVTLGEETKVGENYNFSAIICDMSGNSVEFLQDFIGFNENPAFLILSEIRTKADSKKLMSDFVEFYCLKGGNTHGLKLCSGYKGEDCDYSFPAIEVKAGEYITLHNKTYDSEKAVNETGDDLTLSKAEESCDEARDLWREGTEQKIGASSDVLILKNYSTGKIYDGILFCKSEAEKLGNKRQCEYAATLDSEGIWKGGTDVDSAFHCEKATTVTRSISRKNVDEIAQKYNSGEIDSVSSSKDDWALTEKYGKPVVSGATPGYENSTNYYEEKKSEEK